MSHGHRDARVTEESLNRADVYVTEREFTPEAVCLRSWKRHGLMPDRLSAVLNERVTLKIGSLCHLNTWPDRGLGMSFKIAYRAVFSNSIGQFCLKFLSYSFARPFWPRRRGA